MKIRCILPNIALPTCSVTPGGLIVMTKISFGSCDVEGAERSADVPIVEFLGSGSG